MAINRMAGVFGRATPYFRGKQRLFDVLCSSDCTVQARIFGVKMPLDLSDTIQRGMFFGYYERLDLQLVASYLRAGGVFVDVGANAGVYTALASKLVGQTGAVIALEPTPTLYRRLSEVFCEHTNVEVVPQAAGAVEGAISLFVPPRSMRNFDPSVVRYCDGMDRIEVPVCTLDSLLDAREIGRVEVLKIDVEGFEPEVLQGAASAFSKKKIVRVLIEENERLLSARGLSSSDIRDFLARHGYIPQKTLTAAGSTDYRNVLYTMESTAALAN